MSGHAPRFVFKCNKAFPNTGLLLTALAPLSSASTSSSHPHASNACMRNSTSCSLTLRGLHLPLLPWSHSVHTVHTPRSLLATKQHPEVNLYNTSVHHTPIVAGTPVEVQTLGSSARRAHLSGLAQKKPALSLLLYTKKLATTFHHSQPLAIPACSFSPLPQRFAYAADPAAETMYVALLTTLPTNHPLPQPRVPAGRTCHSPPKPLHQNLTASSQRQVPVTTAMPQLNVPQLAAPAAAVCYSWRCTAAHSASSPEPRALESSLSLRSDTGSSMPRPSPAVDCFLFLGA